MRLGQKAAGRLLVVLAFGTLTGVGLMSSWRKTRAVKQEQRLSSLDR